MKGIKMAIQKWSKKILVVDLSDDPQFTDDIIGLTDALEGQPNDVALNFAAVGFINSSDIAKILRLRKIMMTIGRRLIICGVNTQIWGVFMVTGLDKIFEFTNDVSTALATLQLAESPGARNTK